MSVEHAPRIDLDADLQLLRTEGARTVQRVRVSCSRGRSVVIESEGALPKRFWQQIRSLKTVAVRLVMESGKGIVFQHNNRVLVRIIADEERPVVSIRWWSIGMALLTRSRERK